MDERLKRVKKQVIPKQFTNEMKKKKNMPISTRDFLPKYKLYKILM